MDTMTTWDYISSKPKEDPYEKIIPIIQELSKDFNTKTEEQQNQALDAILKEIRKINIFPIFYFNEEGINQEIQSVINKTDICIIDHSVFTQLRNGLLLLDFLFPNLHYATTCNEKRNMYERFFDDEILKTCLKKWFISEKPLNNLRTMFFSVGRLYWDTPINFSPMRAKIIFESFCPPGGTIYDYSAGYGGRMLGALGSDRNFQYICTDPNTDTYKNLLRLGEYIEKNTKRTNSYRVYNLCSEQLQLKENSIDFAFSCPPFFNKECYTDEDTQSISKYPYYKEWLEEYVRKTIQNCYYCLKENGIYGVDILDYYVSGKRIPLIEDWIKIAEEEGFFLKDKIPIKSRYRKKADETEFIYLFMKSKDLQLPIFTTEDVLSKAIDSKKDRERRAFRRSHMTIAEYDINGVLQNTYNSYDKINIDKQILKSKKIYNNKYYRIYYGEDIIKTEIEVKKPVCAVGENYFFSLSELGRYLNVSRQAISQAKQKNKNIIANQEIVWL